MKRAQNYIIYLCSSCSNALLYDYRVSSFEEDLSHSSAKHLQWGYFSLKLLFFLWNFTCWELPVNSFCLCLYFTVSQQLWKRKNLCVTPSFDHLYLERLVSLKAKDVWIYHFCVSLVLSGECERFYSSLFLWSRTLVRHSKHKCN